MDLSKKEKFIWNLSAKTEISNIPDKDRVGKYFTANGHP